MATRSLNPIVETIVAGEAPRAMALAAARGLLPVSPVDLVDALLHLVESDDPDVREASATTLASTDPSVLSDWVREGEDAHGIDRLVRRTEDATVLEAVIRSRATTDDTLVWLAERLHPDLQDVLAVNQARLLRQPRILEALGRNPRLTADARRRIHEIEEEFFRKRGTTSAAAAEAAEAAAAAPPPLEEVEEAAAGFPPLPGEEEQAAEGALFEEIELPEEMTSEEVELDDEKRKSLLVEISLMTVSQKLTLATKGNKEARSILIRDTNRLVCSAAVASPRMTPNEIESIAAMRNVHEEVLRHIATHREWSRKYPVMLNLVRNPRVPSELCMPFIVRLTQRDMKSLASDKGVPELVRTAAKRMYQMKYQQAKG